MFGSAAIKVLITTSAMRSTISEGSMPCDDK
jgi:hypothetical protein